MLAPIALVLLGYHYLFHSKLNAEVAERRNQESALVEDTRDIQQKQSLILSQMTRANKSLEEAENKSQVAAQSLKDVNADKAYIRSLVLGNVNAIDTSKQEQTQKSLLGAFSTMLTSTAVVESVDDKIDVGESGGKCGHMNLLCSILDAHQLVRLENSAPSSGARGFLGAERTELGRLLGISLPEIARYKLQLEGSFTNLIAALHQLDERLQAVDILSLSLRPVRESERYVWTLEVGIKG